MNLIHYHFVFLVPFRNVKNYINECVESILKQEYNNYTIFLLDDCSNDGTLESLKYKNEKIKIAKNSKRVGPTENLYNALVSLDIDSESVIVWLDGDDCLYGEYVLQILNYHYNRGAMLTYGQYIDSFGRVGFCSPYSVKEVQNIRQSAWKASHLKTFKKSLFNSYKNIDQQAYHLKDHEGRFLMSTSDMAFMLPLIEVAGYDKIKFIENIIYSYRISPHNDHSTEEGRKDQIESEKIIRNKEKIIF